MFIHIIVMDRQSSFLTHTTWSNFSKLLDQNRFHHITNHSQDQEEDFCSCSFTLDQSTLSPDLEDGNTMIGSEQWSGIMSSLLLSTLDSLRPDISHSSSVQSSQYSTMFTLTTNSNNWLTPGLIMLSFNKMLTWDTPKSNSNIIELILSTNTSRRGLLPISSATQSLTLMPISIRDVSQCWLKFRTSNKTISRVKWEILLTDQSKRY